MSTVTKRMILLLAGGVPTLALLWGLMWAWDVYLEDIDSKYYTAAYFLTTVAVLGVPLIIFFITTAACVTDSEHKVDDHFDNLTGSFSRGRAKLSQRLSSAPLLGDPCYACDHAMTVDQKFCPQCGTGRKS